MMQPRRIAFPYAGDQYGGSSVSSLLLARALRERGHDVRVVMHGTGTMHDAARAAGFSPLMLPALATTATDTAHHRWQWSQLTAIAPLRAVIRREKFDIVHINDLAMLRRWTLPTRLAGAKLVNHWRSNFSGSASVTAALALSDRIVPISRYSLERLPARLHGRCRLEYNPFEQNFLDSKSRLAARAARRAELGVAEDAFVIATFGSYTVRKNTHRLADIVAALPEIDGRPLLALAFGKPAAPHDLLLDARMEAPEVHPRLRKVPFVADPVNWMAACDIVLVPAEREPFGRTPFEAAMAGTPSILSSDSGAAEIARDGDDTLLVHPGNVPGWIDAVARLADMRTADRLVAGARERVRDMAPAAHAARIEAIYTELFAPIASAHRSGEAVA